MFFVLVSNNNLHYLIITFNLALITHN